MKLYIALIVVVAFAYSMASQKGKLKSKLKKKTNNWEMACIIFLILLLTVFHRLYDRWDYHCACVWRHRRFSRSTRSLFKEWKSAFSFDLKSIFYKGEVCEIKTA